MRDKDKTKEQLINELMELRQRVAELKASETENKRTEEALRESERRFAAFMTYFPGVAFMKNRQGQYLYMNETCAKILGAKLEDRQGKTDNEVLPAAVAQQLRANDQIVMTEGRRLETIEEMPQEDGVHQWLIIKFPIINKSNESIILGGIAVDITERKRAEEALGQEQHLLHALLDNIPAAIYFKDTESRFIRINKAQADRLGLSDPTQALGKTDFDFLAEEYARPVYEQEQEIMRSGQILIIEEQEKPYLDGREGWVAATKIPLRDEKGCIIGTFGIIRDITERRKAEEALRKSEREKLAILDSMSERVSYLDSEMRFIWANKVAAEVTKQTTEELIGRSCYEIWQQRNTPCIDCPIVQTYKTGQTHESEIRSPDGEIWLVRGYPIKDDNGEVVRVVEVSLNITRLKKAEERIKASLKEKEVLLQEIHHRVKNNMQVVSSLLKLQAGKMKDEKLKQAFKESQRRISAMAIVHETLYRSESMAEIELQKHIPALVDSIYRTFRTKGKVALQVDVEDITLGIGQSVPLSLVINELISNSFKHAFPEGKGEIVVKVRLRGDDEIEVVISDNGRGLPEDIDYEKSLGLQLVKGLVESQLGGTLDIKTEAGTKHTIRFKKKEWAGTSG